MPPIPGNTQVSERIWNYRIIRQHDRIMSLNEGSWRALKNQDDFTELMRVIVRDNSELAVICHVSSSFLPPILIRNPAPKE